MAERKLTKSELRLKKSDPKRFAELQKIRARRVKGYKRPLGPKVVKPIKKKEKKLNQRIGRGTMKPGLDNAYKSAIERENERKSKSKPVIAVKPNKPKRGSMKPGLDNAYKSAIERENKIRPLPKDIPNKSVVVKKPKKPKKPDLTYREDEGSPIGTAPEKSTKTYTPRKKYEGGIDFYETPFGRIKADSSDDAFSFDVEEKDGGYLKRDMMIKRKKGGSIKKKIKKGKVKKRASLRGQGKALRGF
tara:strand:- start:3253 stop:3990 length:738 start_codon:yes stop_codon:yes gene_type:complete